MHKPTLDMARASRLVDALRGRRVLVLGDVMLDRHWWGTVSRISPEAPVPVIHKQRSTLTPGGAANVAANIASLGGIPTLIGMTGSDEAGSELRTALQQRGICAEHLIIDANRPTTVKTRIIAHSQHVVRVDEEEKSPISLSLGAQITDRVLALLESTDLVVVSDYAKGLLTPDLLQGVIHHTSSRSRRVIVDPKGTDYARYNGAYLLSPNRLEALTAADILPDAPDGVRRAGRHLLDSLTIEAVLVTQGEAGMTLFEHDRKPMHLPAVARAVHDVTGAGDTVVAVLSLALAAQIPLPTAAQLANLAAGLAVEQLGTATVTAAQLRRAVREGYRRGIHLSPIGASCPQASAANSLSAHV